MAIPTPNKTAAKELRADTKLVHLLRTAAQSSADEEGWAFLGAIGNHIANHSSDFDPRNYGYVKPGELVAASELFEIQVRESKPGHPQKYIRDRRLKKT